MTNTEWLYEKIDYLKNGNWIYKTVCFFMGKRKSKLNYNEMFLLLYGINRKKLGEEMSRKVALAKIIQIYKDNNNRLPNGLKDDD